MRTIRQTSLRRALLQVLSWVPDGYTLPDRTLCADASRLVTPAPTQAELDAEIREADTARLIVGIPGEDSIQRQITDAGQLWLAKNP